jgi:UDPglucose--hexose-1-phosphate uridylyltransferase
MPRPARTDLVQPDGRHVYLYDDFEAAPAGYEAPEIGQGAYERRWNPLRQEWVLVAAARQSRTFLPARANCPLDPSAAGRSTEIPAARFDAAVFENRFPSMLSSAGGGVCEVVVYTDEHEGSFASLSPASLERLVEVWTDRYRALSRRDDVNYVYIFENRGEQVGVTLHHPHGQIYGYPFIPPVAQSELKGRSQACRQCRLIKDEVDDGSRMLLSEKGVVAYVPAYARWPYEVHLATTAHRPSLVDLAGAERRTLVHTMQRVTQAYDRLFQVPMPYMMLIHQRPTDGRDYPQAHLHVEFYPILRDSGKLKYLAGSESGAGVFINDTLAEASAARLRELIESPV